MTTRSGVLIVIDTGYLGIWSHDQAPLIPEGGPYDEGDATLANSAVDLRIVGADAERAGRLLDMSWHPLYLYDQPPDYSWLRSKFDEVVRTYKLDAHLDLLPERISHRRRVDLALQRGAGAGEIQFHGIWAAVVGGVPLSQRLPIFAEPAPPPDNACWARVSIECRPRTPVARSELVGFVGVDYARLLVADVDALGAWKHGDSLDGMADYVFWGRDAEQVASALGAPRLDADQFGWADVPRRWRRSAGAPWKPIAKSTPSSSRLTIALILIIGAS